MKELLSHYVADVGKTRKRTDTTDLAIMKHLFIQS